MVVVGLAVRLPVPLEEVPGAELLAAVGAHEVVRMPRPSQRRHHLRFHHNNNHNNNNNNNKIHLVIIMTIQLLSLSRFGLQQTRNTVINGSDWIILCLIILMKIESKVLTCPTMGLSQAVQQPLVVAEIPCLFISACKETFNQEINCVNKTEK